MGKRESIRKDSLFILYRSTRRRPDHTIETAPVLGSAQFFQFQGVSFRHRKLLLHKKAQEKIVKWQF